MINYTSLKSPCRENFKYEKIFAKFQKLNFYSQKTENVQTSLKVSVQKTGQNFFTKVMQSTFFCSRLSKEL